MSAVGQGGQADNERTHGLRGGFTLTTQNHYHEIPRRRHLQRQALSRCRAGHHSASTRAAARPGALCRHQAVQRPQQRRQRAPRFRWRKPRRNWPDKMLAPSPAQKRAQRQIIPPLASGPIVPARRLCRSQLQLSVAAALGSRRAAVRSTRGHREHLATVESATRMRWTIRGNCAAKPRRVGARARSASSELPRPAVGVCPAWPTRRSSTPVRR